MLFIGGEKVIGNINLIEIQGAQIFEFIGNLNRVPVAHPGAHHFAADAKNAFKRASAAGG